MDFCEELQKPSIQCQIAKPNVKIRGGQGNKAVTENILTQNCAKIKAARPWPSL
jgi:hypothetical protein